MVEPACPRVAAARRHSHRRHHHYYDNISHNSAGGYSQATGINHSSHGASRRLHWSNPHVREPPRGATATASTTITTAIIIITFTRFPATQRAATVRQLGSTTVAVAPHGGYTGRTRMSESSRREAPQPPPLPLLPLLLLGHRLVLDHVRFA